jgi:regulator of nucleoside diphosphate kinase
MHVEIHASGLTLTDLLRQRLQSRLASALRPFLRSVSRVSAHLADVNARRGGIDKRCRLVATLPGRKQIVVDALHADPVASIDYAASRFRQALSRALARVRSSRKRAAAHQSRDTSGHTPDAPAHLLLSHTDAPRLREILTAPGPAPDARPALDQLQHHLDRAAILPAADMPAAVVTMRSRVRILDLHTGEKDTFTLVYPHEADLFDAKLSILSPLGAALLGAKVGDTLHVPVKSGTRRIQLDALLYQPEAAGDFDA